MSPKTKEQIEDNKREKREMILQSALEIFAIHGYHGTSISTIAKKAGIAKGLLYTYFKSKEELLHAIIDDGLNTTLGIYEPILKNDLPDIDLTPELFREFFGKLFRSIKENESFWRLYFAIVMQPGILEMIVKEYEGMMFSQLVLLEKYYRSQGSKKPRADALHAYLLIDGLIMNIIQPHNEFSMEELEKDVIAKLENPIY